MITSQGGINLIKQFEGCVLKPYKCQADRWTIGYGHTQGITGNTPAINQLQADNFLREDLKQFEYQINSLNLVLNQNQFDALVSLVYNIGIGTFKKSILYAMIKANPVSANIPTEWARFKYAKGVPLLGLIKRRQKEIELYSK